MSDSSSRIVVGQRYISDAEPELGLGLVVGVDERVVALAFAAADETRRYVAASAPLRRVRFAIGDTLTDDAGRTHRVNAIEERGGIVVYRSDAGELAEAQVAASTAVTGPRERLAAGRIDASLLFDLRAETMSRLHEIRRSPVRGFVGPRIELLPHQFSVAAEVSSRLVARVLLADETGLGKTIEAGLILSRLILAGRAQRALVLVPDSLVHQWLVELRRRFQLRFAVFDEARCEASEASEPGANPFAQEQLVLAGLSLLTASPWRTAQSAEAGWDIVVVDEAHHLQWSRERAGDAYLAVETVARRSEGLLLLTATPEQLGAEGHFARLRLLDPDRYGDYHAWQREAERYRDAARIATALTGDAALSDGDARELAALLAIDAPQLQRRSQQPRLRRELLAGLIDRHGPGRVMFRNTRAAVSGFPQRAVHRHALAPGEGLSRGSRTGTATLIQRIDEELASDFAAASGEPTDATTVDLQEDARVGWLARLLSPEGPRKVLVLCSSRQKTEALEAALAARLRISTAVFHEGLTLVQRDRNAAWFAEADGARLMICSELGSEGRNFQHAQHLVLFDLPLDPDLVEQRIGRLDRIGQRGTVEIHLPFVSGSGMEVIAHWLDEGVGALRRPSLIARPLLERFGQRVRSLALAASQLGEQERSAAIDALVGETSAAAAELATQVEQGRDRLLEMASLRRELADPLITRVRELDEDGDFEDYFLRVLEHFHVYAEEVAPRAYLLNPDGMRMPEFPSLDRGETVLAFDRETALVREDLAWATRDHPLLGDAMELLLASPSGNASFAILEEDCVPRLWLEALFVLEPVAPARLHTDRFLAPTPIRVIVDQHFAEPSASEDPATADLRDGHGPWIAANEKTLGLLLARLGERCDELAERKAAELRSVAHAEMDAQLSSEIERLAALAAVNDHVRAEETAWLATQQRELALAIDRARLRPDALRLIWQGPARDGAPVTGTPRKIGRSGSDPDFPNSAPRAMRGLTPNSRVRDQVQTWSRIGNDDVRRLPDLARTTV